MKRPTAAALLVAVTPACAHAQDYPARSVRVLAGKLEVLEKQTAALAFRHDTQAADTRAQFKQVIDTLRKLMVTPEPKRRPIRFVYPKEKK